MNRGYFYCSTTKGNPITGPNAISTSDLTGVPAGPDGEWTCYEVPIETVSKYTTKTLNLLERLGIYILFP